MLLFRPMLRSCTKLRTISATSRLNSILNTTRYSSSTLNMSNQDPHSESTSGIHEWKRRAPYRVHDANEDFKSLYEASCHCGKVQYQLAREKPLDSKLCHCTTCQTQHGKFHPFANNWSFAKVYSCAVPMGCHFPQGRHQLHKGPSRPGVV